MKKEVGNFTLTDFTHDSSNFHVKKNVITENYKIHSHNYFEIEFIKSGSGFELINGKRYEIKPGLFYLLMPTDLHEVQLNKPAEIITISFDISIIPQHLSKHFYISNANSVYTLKDSEYSFIDSILEKIYQEFHNPQTYTDQIISNIMEIILIFIIRKSLNAFKNSDKTNAILNSINYINLHYNENPSLKTIANEVGFSQAYFCSVFKKYLKKTYSEYLATVKIAHAKKKLLMDNNILIIDVAMSSGFNSISNFNRTFKRIVGCSPLKYKEQNIDK